VQFETERGPKGMVAVNVKIYKEKPKPVTPPPAADAEAKTEDKPAGEEKPAADALEAPKPE